ncbi:MAG TPA: hypothetical protein VKF83_12640 [Stellaceae bacterium]|nr:hypothetical protein [Stellaceae bacterium]
MPTAASRSPDQAAAIEAASDYLASEAHYLSVAGRILAALRGEGSLVLITGDPPADPLPLSGALRKLAGSRHRVIEMPCGPELTGDEVSRAGSVVAALAAGDGTVILSDTAETASPLFVFGEADRLADRQIEEICAAVQCGARHKPAGMLLARPGFLARLAEPPLQRPREALAARLRFDEIGDDEGIDFLRHQLAARHLEDETRRVRPIFLRGLTVLGAVSAIVIAAFLALHYAKTPDLKMPSEPSAPSAGKALTGIAAPQPAPAPRAVPSATPLPPAPESAKPPAPAGPTSAPSQPEKMPEPNASHTAPGAARDAAAPQVPSRPVQPPAGQGPSPAEIAALVARGDAFLSAADIASARLFYERAAAAGDSVAALRLGVTFDPNFLGRAGIRGNPGDPAQAALWYRRARDLGDAAAAERLKALERQPR